MHACRIAFAPLAIGLAVALLAPVTLVAQPVETEKGKKSTEEDRRLQAQIKQLKDNIAQLERDLADTRHALRSVPGPRGPHGPSDLDIALGAFTRLLELPHTEGWLRSKVIRTIRDVWGARDLGLKGALDAFAAILEREGHDDAVCTIVLGAAEAMGPEAGPLFEAIRSLDTRGRPALRDGKARALYSIAAGRHIEAVVQKVDQELKFVMLSIGADDGAAKGSRFTIQRDGRILGEVRIDYVYPKSCSASFVLLKPGAQFRAGDRAVYSRQLAPDAAFVTTPFPSPALKAVVQKVDPELEFVMLSVGADDGVAESMRFTIVRNERTLGEVRVDYVYPKSCSASFVCVESGQQFHAGDRAVYSTRRSEPGWNGTIIARVSGSNKVYINLGSRQGLEVGTRFEVFADEESGEGKTVRPRRKGRIRVIEVRDDYALADVVSETDADNPVVVGDRVRIEVAPKRRRL